MKLDILAFAAHPDDIELTASGTMLRHKALGYKLGIVDLTRGELGTRGTVEDREKEAAAASLIMQLDARENLGMEDGFFENNYTNKLKVIEAIRAYKPDTILCNAVSDRHIDHGRASTLVSEACFLSGLRKIETFREGKAQEAWRPRQVLHYIQDRYIKPDVVIDITAYFQQKMECVLAFKTQFYDPNSEEPETPISGKDFLDYLESRAREMGRYINVSYGEGFTVERPVGVADLTKLS